MQEALNDPITAPLHIAISANAMEAAFRVAQSVFFRASWMLDIAADNIFTAVPPPACAKVDVDHLTREPTTESHNGKMRALL